MSSPLVIRRVLMTGAVVGITVSGTLYGAGLKMDQEVKEDARKREAETIDEKIQALESRKKSLLAGKKGLEEQIRDLEAKRGKRAEQLQLQQQEQERERERGQKREE